MSAFTSEEEKKRQFILVRLAEWKLGGATFDRKSFDLKFYSHLGRGSGLAVSVLDFCSDDPSSILAGC